MYISARTWDEVRRVEVAINAAAHRAQDALRVPVSLVPCAVNDDMVVAHTFMAQAAELMTPLMDVYDYANRDNRVDYADLMHLQHHIYGLREVIDLWVERLLAEPAA